MGIKVAFVLRTIGRVFRLFFLSSANQNDDNSSPRAQGEVKINFQNKHAKTTLKLLSFVFGGMFLPWNIFKATYSFHLGFVKQKSVWGRCLAPFILFRK